MSATGAHERVRFLLDDPDAGHKLAEHLNTLKIRAAFGDLCEWFGCHDPEREMHLRRRLRDFLAQGSLIEVDQGLYCGPALREALPSRKGAARKSHAARRDTTERDRDAARFLGFIGAHGGEIDKKALLAEGARLEMPVKRIDYLIQYLRSTRKVVNIGMGRYRLVVEGTEQLSGIE